MSKVKISSLLLMILLTFTASASVASADGTSEIEFNALVNGECFVGLTGMILLPNPPYYDLWTMFDGLGKGVVGMNGSSEAVAVPTSPPTVPPTEPPTEPSLYLLGEEVYFAESLSAQGFASVSWKDNNKIKHWLFVSIYSIEPNPISNIFSPETDYFWMPIPPQGTLLGFDAIHVSRLGYEVISGMALFDVMPFPFEPWVEELYDPAVVLFLSWMDGGIQYQYSILWSSETREITHLYPFDPFDVKAAKVFNLNVEIIS